MSRRNQTADFDAIVVGAGMSGLSISHRLKNELGLSVVGIEEGFKPGGTWFWNRYIGVQADTDSFAYRFSADRETSPEWDMGARYQTGAQMRDYLEAFAARHGLNDIYRYGVRAVRAEYNSSKGFWCMDLASGEQVTTRYLVNAVGVLSKPHKPDIPGIENFKGKIVHTSRWPDELDLKGMRVGLIGTGSTGAQVVAAASQVAKELVVFQRTPQYIVPAGQRRISDAVVTSYVNGFTEVWDNWRKSRLACGFEEASQRAEEDSKEAQQKIFEQAWNEGGGFQFMFGTYSDLTFDLHANHAACDFIRGKIREIVKDNSVAEMLCPTELYARRPVSADGYYEAFNQSNATCRAESQISQLLMLSGISNGC